MQGFVHKSHDLVAEMAPDACPVVDPYVSIGRSLDELLELGRLLGWVAKAD